MKHILSVLLFAALAVSSAFAQDAPAFAQVGAAALPGAGGQVGYVSARGFYTVEGLLQASAEPDALGGDGAVQVAAAVGGAVRVLGTVRLFTGTPPTYDLDLGVRFGPGLGFKPDETAADENRRFRLFFEPFARGAWRVSSGAALFAEVGPARPTLRAGLWLRLGR